LQHPIRQNSVREFCSREWVLKSRLQTARGNRAKTATPIATTLLQPFSEKLIGPATMDKLVEPQLSDSEKSEIIGALDFFSFQLELKLAPSVFREHIKPKIQELKALFRVEKSDAPRTQ